MGATRADSELGHGEKSMGHASGTGDDNATLELAGALDVRRTAEVRAQVYALLETCTGDVVVDVSRVESMDMTTLKLFAVANRVAERDGRRVVLRGASPGVRRLLHFAHLRSRIPVEPATGPTPV